MEMFDIVDDLGNPTGETVERKEAHRLGIKHRTAHIWVIRRNGSKVDVLLQKRADNKDSFPSRFDTSSAGHIQAGDEPKESAIRELGEELGINANDDELLFIGNFNIKYEKVFHEKEFKDNEVAFVYLYEKEIDINRLALQESEVSAVEWFDVDYLYNELLAHNKKFCVPLDGLRVLMSHLGKI